MENKKFLDLEGLSYYNSKIQGKIDSPATTENIGSVIIGEGLDVDENGKIDVKAGSGITVDENGVSETPYVDYLPIDIHETEYTYNDTSTVSTVNYSIIPNEYQPEIVMSDADDPDVVKRASEFDYIYKPTLMTNCFAWNTSEYYTYGPLIIDDDIKVANNLGSGTDWTRPIIGIDNDGIMHNINGSTAADNVGYPNAFRAWYCLYNDGSTNPDLNTTTKEPRTFLAQDYDGNYLIGVCGGRKTDDTGMTLPNVIDFVLNTAGFSAKLIYNLDGGGSSNFLYHGIRQNKLVAREDRACPNWLIWRSKTAKHDGIFKSQSVNNEKNIFLTSQNDGYAIDKDGIISKYTIHERVTINPNSRLFQINPRCLNFNLNFTVTGEGNLPAYTDIIGGLPNTFGNVYFDILCIDDYTIHLGYIHPDSGHSALRTRYALAPGNYTVNLTLATSEMY